MSNSEIGTPHRSLLSPVRVVAICGTNNETVKYLTLDAKPCITETLQDLARNHPEVLTDPNLQAAVVIEGVKHAQLFKADTFRWLCGAGPDPAGKDPNWMGGAAEGSTLDAS